MEYLLLITVLSTITLLKTRANYINDDPSNIDTDQTELKSIECFRKMKMSHMNSQHQIRYNRIVGGVNTTIKEHPFIVSLQMRDGSHMCGGSLINVLWVLSASHCITIGMDATLRDPGNYIIVAGLSDVTRILDHGQSREIDAFIKHPAFTRPLLHNDIALIKMKNPLHLSRTVKLVPLPQYDELNGTDVLRKYTECMALGWGARRPRTGKPYEELSEQEKLEIEDDTVSPILKSVNLPVISIRQCKYIINDEYITNRHLCTMFQHGGKDACEGDSGGPLMCGNEQFGITSWGHGCALPGTPGIFARVDTYREWIDNVITGGSNVDPYNFSKQIRCSNLIILVIIIFDIKIQFRF